MNLHPLLVPALVTGLVLGAVGGVASTRNSQRGEAGDAGSDAWRPAPPKWTPGDIHDQACRHAKALGCDVGDLGACATSLARSNDAIWKMRIETVIAAQNKRHVRDSSILSCDAGNDLEWDGDGEAPPAWRARTGRKGEP
jgi:hypothetical protein